MNSKQRRAQRRKFLSGYPLPMPKPLWPIEWVGVEPSAVDQAVRFPTLYSHQTAARALLVQDTSSGVVAKLDFYNFKTPVLCVPFNEGKEVFIKATEELSKMAEGGAPIVVKPEYKTDADGKQTIDILNFTKLE